MIIKKVKNYVEGIDFETRYKIVIDGVTISELSKIIEIANT